MSQGRLKNPSVARSKRSHVSVPDRAAPYLGLVTHTKDMALELVKHFFSGFNFSADNELNEETTKETQAVSRFVTFIGNYPFLTQILFAAIVTIPVYFPKSKLRTDFFPSIDEKDEELVVFIVTDMDVDEAHLALQKFDNEWWLGVMPDAQNKLLISVDFA